MEKALTAASVDLVSAIASGDASAEVTLIHQYERGMKLILMRRVADFDAVNDILQETFSAVIFAIRDNKINDPERLPGFIRQVALNQLKTHYRKSSRYQTNQGEHINKRPDTSNSNDAITSLEQQQTKKMLINAMRQLSTERDRQLLLRFYLREEDKSSICEDLELSPEHFDRVLYRARQRMKKILEDNPDLKATLLPEGR